MINRMNFKKMFLTLSIILYGGVSTKIANAAATSDLEIFTWEIPTIVSWVVKSVFILIVVVFAMSIYWMVTNKTQKKWRRGFKYFFLTLALILVAICNLAIDKFSFTINQFLHSNVDEIALEQATTDSLNLVEEISDEGFVLLENKNNTLPLDITKDSEKNINVFGQTSINLTYGGAGSGGGDESLNLSLKTGLENAGFKVNQQLTEFYESVAPEKEEVNIFNLAGGNYYLDEPETSEFSDELLNSSREFSDVAVIVLSRNGGEGGDLPFDMTDYGGSPDYHYLELSESEKEMIEMVKSLKFEKVVVLINSSHAMELGFLEEDGIDAALWIGGPGSAGVNSVGKILSGQVNPSGRLVDTYVYDVTSAPSYYNTGDFTFTNAKYQANNFFGSGYTTKYHKFVNYVEGIYVGYRYYETRYVNNATGEVDEQTYQNVVQYPFGYGLSYSNFEQEIINYQTNDDTITMEVKVTNTGNTTGKEVVQLYYTAPYYEGGIEKSHVTLAAFDKTELLQPGQSELVKLEIPVEEMASYDYINEKAYVLDAGTYEIKLMKNSHEIIESREYEVEETIIYNEDNKRVSDDTFATNQFDDVSSDIVYLSRADWEGTLPTERATDTEATAEVLAALSDLTPVDNEGAEEIVFAQHGLKLKDMIGLDYSDPLWDQFMEQLSIEQMKMLIGRGAYATQAINSIGKPLTTDIDGPAGLNGLLSDISGVQYTSQVVIASTWNVELAEKMGSTMANEALANGVSGLYSPGVNIHRSPFSGRNFEYYSEDPLISGKMAAGVVEGGATKGVYYYLKHFAVNDQETNRFQVTTWTNEQALREIYLKAFEIPVKEANAMAIMTSVNRIGTKWTGGSYELLTTVLRDEWGFRGMVVTDNCMGDYANVDQAIRAGNDLILAPLEFDGDNPTELSTETNTGRQALRTASKNILYTVANSAGMELGARQTFPSWVTIFIAVDVTLVALIGFGFYRAAHKKYKVKSKKEKKAGESLFNKNKTTTA